MSGLTEKEINISPSLPECIAVDFLPVFRAREGGTTLWRSTVLVLHLSLELGDRLQVTQSL